MEKKSRVDFAQTRWNGLCPRWDPLKLDGWIRYWMQQHYADANNIWEPDLQARVWKETDDTGILIETVGRWKPQLTELRPALIVKGHALRPMIQGLGANRMQGNPNGKHFYSTLFNGSHTVFCISRAEGECKLLAGETYHELLKFAPAVRHRLDLVRCTLAEVGEMAKLEEASENFVVPVTIAYAFWTSHEITVEDTKVLNRIDLTVHP